MLHIARRRNASSTCSMNSAESSRFCARQREPTACCPPASSRERMVAAVTPYCEQTFITPMAAVAGAVAEEILIAMTAAATALAGLCKQWRRHRTASRARRAFCRRHGGAAGPSIAFRNRDARFGATGARHCDQRLARPQFFAWHRRRGDRPGRPCRMPPTPPQPSSPTRWICRDIRLLFACPLAVSLPTAIWATGW